MVDLSGAQLSWSNHGWVALLADPPLMATGGSRTEALRNLRARAEGRTPKNERPQLRLCRPCDERAAEAGEVAHTVGVEVCLECATKIDQWKKDIEKWRRRRAKIRRKQRK